MNMNSLVIAVQPARACIYRTAHPNDVHAPVELIEIDTISAQNDAGGGGRSAISGVPAQNSTSAAPLSNGAKRLFAHRIAERAAAFAHEHFCNPVILTASEGLSDLLLVELEHELPRTYIRSVAADVSNLNQRELLRALEEEEAFTAKQYPMRG